MNFKICYLVFLEVIPFENIVGMVAKEFAIRWKKSRYKVFVHLLLELLVNSLLNCVIF